MTIDISNLNTLTLEENVKNNFKRAGNETTLIHTLQVRYNILNLAKRFGIDEEKAVAAALLHDISSLIPTSNYLETAELYGLEILPEERRIPLLLHQKLSRVIAVETFNISDKEVLNAIACHSTLRKNASDLDKILFLADKLSWKPEDLPPFMPLVNNQLRHSLNGAVYCYLFNYRQQLDSQAVHPWLKEALSDLRPLAMAS